MIRSVTEEFPEEWQITVTVERSGGRDRLGNTLPSTTHEIASCILGVGASMEQAGLTDISLTTLPLYAPVGADIKSTDVIVVPAHPAYSGMQGRYSVKGRVKSHPLGVEALLQGA